VKSKRPKKNNPAKKKFFLHIRFFGICVLLVSLSSLAIGLSKHEQVLLLCGTGLFITLLYCCIACLLLGLFYKKKAYNLSAKIIPQKAAAGMDGFFVLSEKRIFFQLPAILIRYKLQLATKDKKQINCIFGKNIFLKKDKNNEGAFEIKYRGAYFGSEDILLVQDIFGFFYFPLKIEQDKNERLLALTSSQDAPPELRNFAGGSAEHNENVTVKTDELLEHRPYIPGDDPRRINWKLYSHSNDLFVRTEEMEPPPHSRYVLLVDTEFDPAIFTPYEGALALDAMCALAFALVQDAKDKIVVEVGWTGSKKLYNGKTEDLREALSYPFADCLGKGGNFPNVAGEKSVLLITLGRSSYNYENCLSQLLAKRQQGQMLEIFFCYTKETAKIICKGNEARYNKNGVYTQTIKI
jgi:hypothetical protein